MSRTIFVNMKIAFVTLFMLASNMLYSQCNFPIQNDHITTDQLQIFQADSSPETCKTLLPVKGMILSSDHTLNEDWYRIRIRLDTSENHLLEIDNSQTDYISVYNYKGEDYDTLYYGGDRIPYANRNGFHRNIIIPLSTSDLWIKVNNRGTYSIPLRIMQIEKFSRFDNNRSFLIGLYFGAMLFFGLLTLLTILWTNHDKTLISYFIYLIFSSLYFYIELGYSDIYFWPQHGHLEEPLIFAIILISLGSFLVFTRHIFLDEVLSIFYDRVYKGTLLAIGLCMLPVITGWNVSDGFFSLYFYIVLILIVGTYLLGLFFGIIAIKNKRTSAPWFLLAISFMVIGYIGKPLSLLGLLPYSIFIQYGGMMGQSIEIILLSSLLIIIYIQRNQTALEMKSQVLELERTALQAQMNPHFIFNSLNSIQRYIIENKKKEAINHMSGFAHLVRKILNASNKSIITLQEDLEIVKEYLNFEKIRFKEKFSFRISVSPRLHPKEIFIPPHIIQPFVENAIKYAFKDRTNGLIQIIIKEKSDLFIIASIIDNGNGIADKSSSYESMSTNIVRKRLVIHNGRKNANDVVINEGDDKPNGVSVHLVIRKRPYTLPDTFNKLK